jgi:rhodanese-related sulfurtransferase
MKRGRTVLAMLFLAMMTTVFFAAAGCDEDAPRIAKEEVKALLGSPGVIIIDARTGGSWADSDRKIKGAVRVDPWDVDSWAGTIPRGKKIIIYCS